MTAVRIELERILASLGETKPATKRGAWWRIAGAGLAAAGIAACVLGFALRDIQPSPHLEKSKAEHPITAAASVPKTKPIAPLLDMVSVKPGEFWIGAADTDINAGADEKPRRPITITQAFSLGKTKVTQAQYKAVMGVNPSGFSSGGRFKGAVDKKDTSDYPVDSVSWLDAVRFCNKLSEREGLPPYYRVHEGNVTVDGGLGYRLPTEAEWEFASRAGTTTIWSFGDDPAQLPEYAWFAANSAGTTHAVALKKPNPLGLFDMYGNVPEWCWDRYDPTYYRKMPLSDPPGSGHGTTRVYRGGGWNSAPAQTRSSARDSLGMSYAVLTVVGLRVARNVGP
jgi:formylglycine-generating enzyme required for sulfatase activity